MALLQGPVVFIDDEVYDPSKPAFELARQIRAAGRPIAEYTTLPTLDNTPHWRSIAFLILDWDLVPGSPGGLGGSTLSGFERENLFEWLDAFMAEIFCPVFIVSAEDVADIERQVSENAGLARATETGRLKVFPKVTLMTGFLDYLEQWVSSSPALTALNIWANEHEAATNRLFQDMDAVAPDWPAYVWRTATLDNIDPSYELASVLSANLLHRIDTLQFDVPAIRDFQGTVKGSSMRRVSQGRTAVPGERLYPTMVLPGDVFRDASEADIVWINLTPACHTVLNRPPSPGVPADPLGTRLHLVRGTKLQRPVSKSALSKQKNDHDGPNGMLIHTLLGDEPYAFEFKERAIAKWGDVADRRIARLLPPFVTLMQQKHSAFLMNEGVPRVDWDLYNPFTG